MSKKDERKPKPPHLPQETPEDGPDETKGRILNDSDIKKDFPFFKAFMEAMTSDIYLDYKDPIKTYLPTSMGWELKEVIPFKAELNERTFNMAVVVGTTNIYKSGLGMILLNMETGVPFHSLEAFKGKDEEETFQKFEETLQKLFVLYLDNEEKYKKHAANVLVLIEQQYGPRPILN